MTTYALRLENNTDTAARVRMGELLALPVGAAPLTSRSALRADGGGAVTVVAGAMSVKVAPFIAWVQGGVSVVQGGYPFVHDAEVTLAIGAGHASLSRTDTIVGVVRDNSFDSSGQVSASVAVVTGTPGSGAPALPTNCVALRDVVVPAGLSAGNGGLQSSNLSTDRRAYLTTAQPLQQRGKVVINATTANKFTSTPITFDVPYSTLPNVVATSQAGDFFASVTAITLTGATLGVFRPDGPLAFSVTCQWIALG